MTLRKCMGSQIHPHFLPSQKTARKLRGLCMVRGAGWALFVFPTSPPPPPPDLLPGTYCDPRGCPTFPIQICTLNPAMPIPLQWTVIGSGAADSFIDVKVDHVLHIPLHQPKRTLDLVETINGSLRSSGLVIDILRGHSSGAPGCYAT